MLSRKYYKVIARAIKENTMQDTQPILNKDSLINDLCVEFKWDNVLFNSNKFVDACND